MDAGRFVAVNLSCLPGELAGERLRLAGVRHISTPCRLARRVSEIDGYCTATSVERRPLPACPAW